jgi:hypothetical protein
MILMMIAHMWILILETVCSHKFLLMTGLLTLFLQIRDQVDFPLHAPCATLLMLSSVTCPKNVDSTRLSSQRCVTKIPLSPALDNDVPSSYRRSQLRLDTPQISTKSWPSMPLQLQAIFHPVPLESAFIRWRNWVLSGEQALGDVADPWVSKSLHGRGWRLYFCCKYLRGETLVQPPALKSNKESQNLYGEHMPKTPDIPFGYLRTVHTNRS